MIKKEIKPWYSTKEKEIQAEWVRKLTDTVNQIHRSYNPDSYYATITANWGIVGQDVANHLNTLYPTNTITGLDYHTGVTTTMPLFCGTTYTTTTINSSGSTVHISFSG